MRKRYFLWVNYFVDLLKWPDDRFAFVTAVLLTHAFLDDKDGWLIFAKDYPSYGIPFSL